MLVVPNYVYFYSSHSFGDPAYMSIPIKEGIREWFSLGIWIAIILDYASVFLTKISLRFLARKKLKWPAFFALSISLTFCIYFAFTLVIFSLQVYDMVSLYEWKALQYDPLPAVKYELFPLSIEQWAKL